MFATGLIAQSTPANPSEARKANMSKINGKAALNNDTQTMTDGNVVAVIKGDIGVRTSAVDGGLVILGFDINNSTARAAKLKVGDVITSVGNVPVATIDDLNAAIATHEPGDVVTVSYKRGDRKLAKEVRINRK